MPSVVMQVEGGPVGRGIQEHLMVQQLVQCARLLFRAFGWRGLVRRAGYLFRLHSGELALRLPSAQDFSGASPAHWAHRYNVEFLRSRYGAEGLDALVHDNVVEEAERLMSGHVQLYGDRWHDVGWPPRWHVNPFTGKEYPRVHWTKVSDADPAMGDIKDVWELSRFPFTFLFARAHLLTGDDRYVEAWWEAVEDWAQQNPPNAGVNWRCGQETSLRAIALCFGLSAFADHPASTPRRRELAACILGASVARVHPTVGYALSQRNNHAISELAFLLTVRAKGERKFLRLLVEVVDDQFYPDGSYSQQSFTYQRLAVHALLWLLLVRPDLPDRARAKLLDAVARSRDFLARCSDPVTGWLPNYGPNDGGLLFHLSSAHYRDFRPLLATLGRPAGREHREPSLWLALPELADWETDAHDQPTTYLTMHGPRSLALTRIGMGRHRPAHADQQAVDVWINGRNILPDPGTFRYTAPAPWQNALTGPEVHTTIHYATTGPLRLGRFLQDVGPIAELIRRAVSGEVEAIVSRRPAADGWLWRALLRRADAYAIVDIADSVDAVSRWNLGETDEIDVMWLADSLPEPVEPRHDDPASGWHSELYGDLRRVDAREAAIPAGTGTIVTFTPKGSVPLSVKEVQEALSPWLPTPAAGPLVNVKIQGVTLR